MFGAKGHGGSGTVALVDIQSGSAGVAILKTGDAPEVFALARDDVSLEKRSDAALASAVIQSLSAAIEKVQKEYTASAKTLRVQQIYCVIGAPWTDSTAGEAFSKLEKPIAITDDMIGSLAKQAVADQKKAGRNDIFEANVMRVLLNGYPTESPEGKHAQEVRILTLLSSSDAAMKQGIQEVLSRSFPDTPITWRSSARAVVSMPAIKESEARLVLIVGAEATDAIVVRKGVLIDRALIPLGVLQITSTIEPGRPAEETIALLEMAEKEQSEASATDEFSQALAKAEPELAHVFGETFAKLSASRKLPEQLALVAPRQFTPWISRFLSRIDFTQFTVSASPFTVSPLPIDDLSGMPEQGARIAADPGLSIAASLVNRELRS